MATIQVSKNAMRMSRTNGSVGKFSADYEKKNGGKSPSLEEFAKHPELFGDNFATEKMGDTDDRRPLSQAELVPKVATWFKSVLRELKSPTRKIKGVSSPNPYHNAAAYEGLKTKRIDPIFKVSSYVPKRGRTTTTVNAEEFLTDIIG